ncbi:MAG: DNA ligase D [Bacteriovorax sp.]|jgi:bifunctional non-homologous end joining protein LigD
MKKLLKTYNKKRDFALTAEPGGKVKRSKSKNLLFVVQEHHASHLHYDFRLELDGVLKSWAIPKGPSLNPADKRLAVEVEDHPMDYATFQGTIPKGQYGGGEVYIWDKGTWNVDGDPHRGLKNGKLEFTLKGKKLKGHFVLFRMAQKKSTSKNNWILKKKTDDEADSDFHLKPIAKEKTVKKKSKWPGFVHPQQAFLVDAPPESEKWVHEIKFDGYRLQPHIWNKKIKLFTRGAKDWSEKFPTLSRSLLELDVDSAILDGEAVVMDEKGKSHFGSLQNALSMRDYSKMRIYLFDLLYLNGEDLRMRPLQERKELLKRLLVKCKPPVYYSEDVKVNGAQFFKISCQYGLEGIVSKDSEAPYTSGRSRLWCKCKCRQQQEFVIGGYTKGKGGRSADLGALLLGTYENVRGKSQFRYVGKVGTGFDFKTLRELVKKVSAIKQKKSPFDIKSPEGRDIRWVKPELLAEISFTEWTADRILRTPVYIGLRNDKSSKEFALTHPEKILFQSEKITKKIIADYYDEVADLMLAHVRDRPLSLYRCPQGTGGKCFYQKHPKVEASLKDLKTFKVREKSEINLYVALDSAQGLRQLVQMNAFEFHTWNCHYQSLMNPDQIVMDFDPDPEVDFKGVVNACFEMKKILDKLKLKSFVKVTGGKGIHIHIPIEPIYTWAQIKAFSKALAEEMVSRNPNDMVATMNKSARKGKIFVDYLRNDYGSTSVAPYVLRAKEISAVALPVEWSELPRLKSADQFTLKKALLKIKHRKSDPWEKILSIKQKIIILE